MNSDSNSMEAIISITLRRTQSIHKQKSKTTKVKASSSQRCLNGPAQAKEGPRSNIPFGIDLREFTLQDRRSTAELRRQPHHDECSQKYETLWLRNC